MDKIEIRVSPLTGVHAINCPACRKPVLLAHRDRYELPNQVPCFRDGDCVPGVYEALSNAQKTPASFEYVLLAGNCPSCHESYFVVEVTFGAFSDAGACEWLGWGEFERGPVKISLCAAPTATDVVPHEWIVAEYDSARGLIQRHTLGPWRLDDPTTVCGPFGVSMCQGSLDEGDPWDRSKKLLLAMWDSLRDLHPDLRAARLLNHGKSRAPSLLGLFHAIRKGIARFAGAH